LFVSLPQIKDNSLSNTEFKVAILRNSKRKKFKILLLCVMVVVFIIVGGEKGECVSSGRNENNKLTTTKRSMWPIFFVHMNGGGCG
jgi:hypothetical protein